MEHRPEGPFEGIAPLRASHRVTLVLLFTAGIWGLATTSGFGAWTRSTLVPFVRETWNVPNQPSHDIHNLIRKLLHVPAYAALGLLLAWAIRSIRYRFIACMVTALIIAVTDELIQGMTPGRNASVRDVGIDVVGALIGTGIGIRLLRKARPARSRADKRD